MTITTPLMDDYFQVQLPKSLNLNRKIQLRQVLTKEKEFDLQDNAKGNMIVMAKGMGKVIPILGGVLSGGLTFATMKPMGERLQKELSKLVNYNEGQYQIDIDTIRKEAEIIEGE